MAHKYEPPSTAIALQARGIAALLRHRGESDRAIAGAILEMLGWKVTSMSVGRWFDKAGDIIPVEIDKPVPVEKRAPIGAMDAMSQLDPATVDLGWELRCVATHELNQIRFIHAAAQAAENDITGANLKQRLDIGAYSVPHVRSLAALLASIPKDESGSAEELDPAMKEWLEGFKEEPKA